MDVTRSLVLKLERRDVLSDDEKQALAALVERVVTHRPGARVVREGDPQTVSLLLVRGIAVREKMLRDGEKQLTELHLPGDFVDLHGFGLKVLDHNVVAATEAEFAVVPHERLERITETRPHLTRLLWLNTLIDAAIHREWLVSVGRRSAYAKVAHLFCELAVRFDVVGIGENGRWPFPLTQQHVADLCGLTAVHVSRTLKLLTADGLAQLKGRELLIADFQKLAKAAEFDPAYLHLARMPR